MSFPHFVQESNLSKFFVLQSRGIAAAFRTKQTKLVNRAGNAAVTDNELRRDVRDELRPVSNCISYVA